MSGNDALIHTFAARSRCVLANNVLDKDRAGKLLQQPPALNISEGLVRPCL